MAKDLQSEIIAVYERYIPDIKANLDNYAFFLGETSVDFIGDIKKLQAKLIVYRDELEESNDIINMVVHNSGRVNVAKENSAINAIQNNEVQNK